MAEGVFSKFLNAKKNKVRIDQAMRRGAIILIDTASGYLGKENARTFGKFFLALIEQEIAERRTAKHPKPYMFFIDEAFEYFKGGNESIQDLLVQARKSFVGLVFAHQHFGQIPLEDRGGFDVGLKMATNVSSDIPALAKFYGVLPEEFYGLGKANGKARWLWVERDAPIRVISVPLGQLEAEPKRSEEEVRAFYEANRTAYGTFERPLHEEPKEEKQDEKPNSEKLWREYHQARAKEMHERGIDDVDYTEIKDPLPRIAPPAEDPTV